MPKRIKAITCPQCGAAIDYEGIKVIGCDYCGTDVVVSKPAEPVSGPEKPADGKELTAWQQYRENYRKVLERTGTAPVARPDPTSHPILFWVVLWVVIMFIGSGFALLIPFTTLLHRQMAESERQPERESPTPVATPALPLKYSVTVESRRSNEVDHLEIPKIEESELPTLSEAELRRTVFSNPVVKVRVFVGSGGDVMLAEALDGHDVLRRAAVRAALKTMFKPRSPAGNLLLTYRFNLISAR